jgi:hypothetical protein
MNNLSLSLSVSHLSLPLSLSPQRVYEDDDGSDDEKEADNVHAQENTDPKTNFVDALKLGMEALKLYFDNDDEGKGEKLEVCLSVRLFLFSVCSSVSLSLSLSADLSALSRLGHL